VSLEIRFHVRPVRRWILWRGSISPNVTRRAITSIVIGFGDCLWFSSSRFACNCIAQSDHFNTSRGSLSRRALAMEPASDELQDPYRNS